MDFNLLFDDKFFHHVNLTAINEHGQASPILLSVENILKNKIVRISLSVFEKLLGYLIALPVPIYSSLIFILINNSRGLPNMWGMYLRAMYYRQKIGYMEPNVLIDQNVNFSFPKGVYLKSFSYIDKNVIFMASEVRIGRRVHIAANVFVSGGGKFIANDYAGVAPNCCIITATETLKSGSRAAGPMVSPEQRDVTRGTVVLEKDSFIGAAAVILTDVVILEGSVVGAGCVITKDTEPWKIYSTSRPKSIGKRKMNPHPSN
jgi:acetyltransferase-like isoleucine patch superfamily enzyme